MPAVKVRPFSADDIPAAGALLAERHRLHRLALPLLSIRFEAVDVATAEVAAAFAAADASGAVAISGDAMVGYLLGAAKPQAAWGPNQWIESAGHATTEPEVMRDLYGAAAARWVEEGRTAHFVLVPASDPALVDAWFRLGFGQQQVHAIRSHPTTPFAVPTPVVVRRAVRADIPVLAELSVELTRHQSRSPVYSSVKPQPFEESLAEWESDFDDPTYTNFVAEVDGTVVGAGIGCALNVSNSNQGLIRPDHAGFLGFATVSPAARGVGAGRALGEAVITWSAEAGYDCVATDWRMTNLLSSRAWPALGFEPTFYRLHRNIGF